VIDNSARRANHGDIVVDISRPHRVTIGTVVGSRGGMFNNDLVDVFWHHLGYTNWEPAGGLLLVELAGRDVAVTDKTMGDSK
jgi:hypothetical protein